MVEKQFARLERMIGAAGLRRLKHSFVVVVGLGAVGSYAVEALARAGIGRLRLVDFDQIRLSNLNRQLYALHSTVGQMKSEVARQRVLDINPHCRAESLNLFVHRECMNTVLEGTPDLLVDAIDSFTPKVELLEAAGRHGLPLVSSMGAALRTDPADLRVKRLSEATHCPLARRIRRELRVRGASTEFLCVYSVEALSHLPAEARAHEEHSESESHWRGRPRMTLGSLPTLTGMFGLTVANTALQILLGEAFPAPRS